MTDRTTSARPRILVIGAGPGLGAAVARRFGRDGFDVTITGRDGDRLDALAAQLREETGAQVNTAIADAADAGGFKASLERIAEWLTPEVVVYNAALLTGDDALTSTVDHLLQAHAVNVVGAISAAQVFTPAMSRLGRGAFLVTGGGLGLAPNPEFATMSIGKAGLRAAAALLHQQLLAAGVHVGTVTVTGNIAPNTVFAPDLIADAFWNLYVEPAGTWTVETIFDGK